MPRLAYLAPCAVVLAACGGNSSTTTTGEASPLVTAALKTRQAGSEKLRLSAKVTLAGGQSLALQGAGAFDNLAGKGVLHSSLTSANNETTTLEEVFDGNTIWLDSPLFTSIFTGGKSWLKIDVDKSARKLGFDFKALTGQTPGDALTQLERTGSVTKVGTEQVGGVETTHYRAKIDPAKVPAGDPVQTLTGELVKSVDAWVDGSGLVRKVHLDYTARTDPTKSARAHIVLDMTFTDFGTNVSATPPPAGQTIDASDSGKLGG